MNFRDRKRSLGAIGIAVSLAAFNSVPVEAATVFWDLAFFSNGSQVGSGEFSYDDSEPLEETFVGNMMASITITSADNWYRLETFSAVVDFTIWRLEDINLVAPSWSPSPSQIGFFAPGPRGISFDRSGTPFDTYAWGFDNFSDSDLVMFSSFLLPNRTEPAFFTQSSFGTSISGTWTATQRNTQTVPEGSTIFSLMAIGMLACCKKALSSKR